MHRSDHQGAFLARPRLLEVPHTPKSLINSLSSDNCDSSPSSKRPSILIRKSILLSNGETVEQQLNLILSKKDRSRTEAQILYEAIKDFAFMQMLCGPSREKSELDYESMIYLTQVLYVEKVKSGDVIYHQDDPSNSKLFVVYSGEVAIIVKDPDPITAENYERFEAEQKKRTMTKLGSLKKMKERISKSQTPKKRRSGQGGGVSERDNEGEDDHLFELLKAYMRNNVEKTEKVEEGLDVREEIVKEKPVAGRDLALFSGISKAVLKFKKVLSKRNAVINHAKDHGVIRERLGVGQFFGGNMALEARKREETALALKDSELLVIEYKDLQYVKASFAKKQIALKNFMFDSFPKLELYQSEKVIMGLMETLEERTYEVNTQIVTEGQGGDYFYLLQSGTCEISKEVIIDEGHALDDVLAQSRMLLRVPRKTRKKVTLTTISKGAFFGDELLFHSQKYHYSVKVVSSKATVQAIRNRTFVARFPPMVFESLKTLYQKKCSHYVKTIKSLLTSVQYENYEIDPNQMKVGAVDKRETQGKQEAKNFWNPIQLRTKKKAANSFLLGSMENSNSKSNTGSIVQQQLSLSKKTSDPLGNTMVTGRKTRGNIRLSNFQFNTPWDNKGALAIDNPIVSEDDRYKPGHRPKNRSMGPVPNEKFIKVLSPCSSIVYDAEGRLIDSETLTSPLLSVQNQIDEEEEADRVKDTFGSRTTLKYGSETLKQITLQGKDYISYINSRNAYKGLMGVKPTNEPKPNKGDNKLFTSREGTPTIDHIKLGIENERGDLRRSFTKRLPVSPKASFDLIKVNSDREKEDALDFRGLKELLSYGGDSPGEISPLRRFQNKLKIDVYSSIKDDSAGTGTGTGNNKSNNPASAISKRQKDSLLSSPLLVRNQSLVTAYTPFAREVNPLDVETPNNTNRYIAEKKHQKLKKRIFSGFFDDFEGTFSDHVALVPYSPCIHSKREVGSESPKKNFIAESSGRIIRGTSIVLSHQSLKPSGLGNFEAASPKKETVNKSLTPKKKGIVPWLDRQSLMLKERSKINKQLRKRGQIKSTYPLTPDATLDINSSLRLAKAL